jgi:hypothetical protein
MVLLMFKSPIYMFSWSENAGQTNQVEYYIIITISKQSAQLTNLELLFAKRTPPVSQPYTHPVATGSSCSAEHSGSGW